MGLTAVERIFMWVMALGFGWVLLADFLADLRIVVRGRPIQGRIFCWPESGFGCSADYESEGSP